MIDDHMFSATYPWDLLRDSLIRTRAVVDPVHSVGDRAPDYLVELGTVYGEEGTDYQNPYVWQGRGVLAFPTLRDPGLVPAYGVDLGQNYSDLLLNVQATQHLAIANY